MATIINSPAQTIYWWQWSCWLYVHVVVYMMSTYCKSCSPHWRSNIATRQFGFMFLLSGSTNTLCLATSFAWPSVLVWLHLKKHVNKGGTTCHRVQWRERQRARLMDCCWYWHEDYVKHWGSIAVWRASSVDQSGSTSKHLSTVFTRSDAVATISFTAQFCAPNFAGQLSQNVSYKQNELDC